MTPAIGKTAKGIIEVAGIGMGSKIHQIAHHKVTAAVIAGAYSHEAPISAR